MHSVFEALGEVIDGLGLFKKVSAIQRHGS